MCAVHALQGPRKKATGMLSLHDKLEDISDEVSFNTYQPRREVLRLSKSGLQSEAQESLLHKLKQRGAEILG